jgi:hypothetical protein
MAYTQADIDALELAMASGAKKVRIRDRETEFRDLTEMRAILKVMKESLSGSKRTAHTFSSFDRGYQ